MLNPSTATRRVPYALAEIEGKARLGTRRGAFIEMHCPMPAHQRGDRRCSAWVAVTESATYGQTIVTGMGCHACAASTDEIAEVLGLVPLDRPGWQPAPAPRRLSGSARPPTRADTRTRARKAGGSQTETIGDHSRHSAWGPLSRMRVVVDPAGDRWELWPCLDCGVWRAVRVPPRPLYDPDLANVMVCTADGRRLWRGRELLPSEPATSGSDDCREDIPW